MQANWIDGSPHLALKIATAVAALALAAASWLRWKKNSLWARQGLATALLALGLLAAVQLLQFLQSFYVPPERPFAGSTVITQKEFDLVRQKLES